MSLIQFSNKKTVPVWLQTEAAECGLACLGMVAHFYGFQSDLPTLRRQFSLSSQGMTLANLLQLSGKLQLSGRPLRLELSALDQLALPAILHWDFNHFVVLVKLNRNGVLIHDPAVGKRDVSLAELSQHFTGVALELAPSSEFRPEIKKQPVKLSQLLGRISGGALAVGQILLLAAVLELVALFTPWLSQLVLDDAVVTADTDLLKLLGIGFLLLAAFKVAVEALRSWVVLVLGTTVNLQLISNLFRHMLNLPYVFFEKRHLGDIVSRFESMNVIQRTLTGSFLEALIDGAMAVSTAVMMFFYSFKLGMLVAVAAVFYLIIRLVLFKPLRVAAEEKILRSAKQQSNLLETVRGIQSLKLFNRESHRRSHFQNLVVDHFNADVRMQKLHILYRVANGLVFSVEHVLVIWLGALLILEKQFSVGMMFAFLAYKDQFSSRIIALIEKMIEFKMLGLHTERVADIALSDVEQNDGGYELSLPPLSPSIQIRSLMFAYADTQAPVLQEVNLQIEAGESVAIVGASGCGKTTLMKVMLGLLKPNQGEVCVGGFDLKQIGVQRFRNMIGSVLQDDHLFAGSIADNICFFDPDATMEQIQQAAKQACIEAEILAMPMGFNTLIGDMGGALSGGQKQRVLLARALYKQPKILFLDEATSHLDIQREKLVNEAIQKMNITRVIIAHRPETIASADRVVFLQQGRVQSLTVQKNQPQVA